MKKDKIIIVRVTEEEEKMIKELRRKHSINISGFIRNAITTHYKKLEKPQ